MHRVHVTAYIVEPNGLPLTSVDQITDYFTFLVYSIFPPEDPGYWVDEHHPTIRSLVERLEFYCFFSAREDVDGTRRLIYTDGDGSVCLILQLQPEHGTLPRFFCTDSPDHPIYIGEDGFVKLAVKPHLMNPLYCSLVFEGAQENFGRLSHDFIHEDHRHRSMQWTLLPSEVSQLVNVLTAIRDGLRPIGSRFSREIESFLRENALAHAATVVQQEGGVPA